MANQLVGFTLTHAVRLYILGHPKVIEAVHSVDGAVIIRLSSEQPYFCNCVEILEGRFPGCPSECWPLQPNVERLAASWIEPPTSFAELEESCDVRSVPALRMVEAAAWEVCQAIAALVLPLALGRVEAHGQAVASGAMGPIAREAWRSPLRSFDISGRLGEVRNGRFEPDWMDVHFTKPGAMAEPEAAGKSKGGRPMKWKWDEAFYLAFCRLSRNGNSLDRTKGSTFADLLGDELDKIHGDRPDLNYIKKKIAQRNPDLWRFLTTTTPPK